MTHLLDLLDWSGDDIRKLLKEAAKLKRAHLRRKEKATLKGRVLGLVFEKPSLRTRVSFEAGVAQLGGSSLFISPNDAGLGKRESIPDFARTISQYVDAVVLRTFRHDTVVRFAEFASIPVINGLSDYYHPCQALGDLLTVRETFGDDFEGKTLAFIGDGNNVARSLAVVCGKLGMRFILSAPDGYGFDRPFLDAYQTAVDHSGVVEENDPFRAVAQADVIYTDVWASMGQEDQAEKRRKAFARYQVNEELLKAAPTHARLMHCLPAHRGEEVTDGVLDGPQSVVFQQAGNRMHAQKALLQRLMLEK